MSSTNRGGERRADDFYESPSWCVRAIMPHVFPTGMVGTVLDPCCGRGAILDVVRAWPDALPLLTYGLDVSAERVTVARGKDHTVTQCDALEEEMWPEADLILMNPPFSLAMDFVTRALAEQGIIGGVPGKEPGTVAALMRLAMLASQKRASFWRAYPADVYVLPKRPSFTEDGKTDSADYAWFVFGHNLGGRWQVLGDGGTLAEVL